MAAERLSRLQKFILTATYRKTILKEALPVKVWRFEEHMKSERDFRGMNGEIVTEQNKYKALYDELYFSALYESDILMNYYKKWTPNENYGYEGGSNKEKTALHRSLKTLYDRGYINKYWQWSQNAGKIKETISFMGNSIPLYDMSYQSKAIITLTEKGKQTAGELLKVVEVPTLGNLQQ